MSSHYLGAIRYQQQDDEATVKPKKGKGKEGPVYKTVTETYLFDAVSYTDAEAALYKHVADNTPDFEIKVIRPKRISDLIESETGDNWYQAKGFYLTENDKGQAKKVAVLAVLNAASLKEALERVTAHMSTMLVPVEITDLNLTPILEVVHHVADEAHA